MTSATAECERRIRHTDCECSYAGDGDDDQSKPLWWTITEDEGIESMDAHCDHEEE